MPEWVQAREAYDAAALATPGILAFCSGSAWQLAAHRSLYPERAVMFFRRGDLWQAWAAGPLAHFGEVLQPLEADWVFGSPLVGAPPAAAAHFLLESMLELSGRYPLILVGGVPSGGVWETLLLSRFTRYFRLFRLPGCDCRIASLEGGWEGFLGRRSGRFRRQLTRIAEDCRSAGVTHEILGSETGTADATLARVLQIERLAWKERAGEGIFAQPRFAGFYTHLMQDLSRDGGLRTVFLRRDGEDVAYVTGGILGGRYRGLQMAYRADCRALGLGHLAQFLMIRHLATEAVQSYDLGMDLDYKRRWSDQLRSITNFLLLRR